MITNSLKIQFLKTRFVWAALYRIRQDFFDGDSDGKSSDSGSADENNSHSSDDSGSTMNAMTDYDESSDNVEQG